MCLPSLHVALRGSRGDPMTRRDRLRDQMVRAETAGAVLTLESMAVIEVRGGMTRVEATVVGGRSVLLTASAMMDDLVMGLYAVGPWVAGEAARTIVRMIAATGPSAPVSVVMIGVNDLQVRSAPMSVEVSVVMIGVNDLQVRSAPMSVVVIGVRIGVNDLLVRSAPMSVVVIGVRIGVNDLLARSAPMSVVVIGVNDLLAHSAPMSGTAVGDIQPTGVTLGTGTTRSLTAGRALDRGVLTVAPRTSSGHSHQRSMMMSPASRLTARS